MRRLRSCWVVVSSAHRYGACGCRNRVVAGQAALRYSLNESATAGRSNDLEVSIWLVWWVGGDGWLLVE